MRPMVAWMAVQTLSRRSSLGHRTTPATRVRRPMVARSRSALAPPLDLLLYRERPETMDPQEVWELRARLGLLGR